MYALCGGSDVTVERVLVAVNVSHRLIRVMARVIVKVSD